MSELPDKYEPKEPSSADKDATEKIERLQCQLGRRFENARLLGIQLYGTVMLPDETSLMSRDETEPRIAASVNKLAIAKWLVDTVPDDQAFPTVVWQKKDRAGIGLGTYDQPGAALEARLDELLIDMLQKSSNTAAIVLGRGHADEINEHMQELGMPKTQLIPKDGGGFGLGLTTPQDALRLVLDLSTTTPESPRLQQIAVSSLLMSHATAGQHIQGDRHIGIISKWGALNSQDRSEPCVRNDVGLMFHDDGQRVGYALFSETKDRFRAKIAEQIIAEIGADIGDFLGAKRIRLSRHLLDQVLRYL